MNKNKTKTIHYFVVFYFSAGAAVTAALNTHFDVVRFVQSKHT